MLDIYCTFYTQFIFLFLLVKPFAICMVLVFVKQMSGATAVLFYSEHIFNAAGIHLGSFVETIISMSVLVISTSLSAVVMDKMARKRLTVLSGFFTSVSLIVLGNTFTF
jgi:hypothetical protein